MNDADEIRGARRRALIALALLVPVPTLGSLAGLLLWPGAPLGIALYAASKVWVLVLPLVWLGLVERGRPSWSPPRLGGLRMGLGLGLAIVVIIGVVYVLLGRQLIDPEAFREIAAEKGFGTPAVYAAFAVYIATINALLEEFVWRWFVFRRCEELVPGRKAAVLAGLFFTLHHVFALRAQFGWDVTLLGSVGVFLGGVIWSWCYLRYRSIWPGYISHALADIAFLLIGGWMLFG